MSKKSVFGVDRTSADWKKSEHHGAGTWLAERLSALALVPLTLWGAWAAFQIAGGGYDAAATFLRSPVHATLLAVTVILTAWHMYMGLRVVIEDYIGKDEGRGFYLFLTFLLCAAVVVASLGGLYCVYSHTAIAGA
ncbi:succinate dehydrogenase, hydrophobic membrane anchor protein [Asticcacaulis solisilvae]|uniref:succinate dehydrogenase, hydrophobic membrane anchor protein n=1 Tax=Asticcacaulis solisilvae TaxID=1217274 RepID=UPI003FD78A70